MGREDRGWPPSHRGTHPGTCEELLKQDVGFPGQSEWGGTRKLLFKILLFARKEITYKAPSFLETLTHTTTTISPLAD